MSITKHFDGRLFEAQELIDKQTARHVVDQDRITELENALTEIRKCWVDSEGISTDPNAYVSLKQCYEIAAEALKK